MLRKKTVPTRTPFQFQVHAEDADAPYRLSVHFAEQFNKVPANRDIVIVCIGTDRSTGDSLGPLIGSSLEKTPLKRFYVYGTLAHPVHAVNLEETLSEIENHHEEPFIIAIDACLGRLKNVGKISFSEGPVMPGAAMKKKLPQVGHMHVTGIVNVSGMMEYFVLQNTRLHTVMTMAECVAESFKLADKNMKKDPVTSFTKKPKDPLIHTKGRSKKESALSLQDENNIH